MAPGAPTRRRMIEAALDLFHSQGVDATSVEQVLEASGTGKSQLYHYFGSKDGLVRAVVEHFAELFASGALPGGSELESLEDLERWFGLFVDYQRTTGCERHCPMATIAGSLTPDQEETRQAIARIFDAARAPLVRLFERWVEAGRLAPDEDAGALADLCYVVMQGGLLVSHVQHDVGSFERAAAQAVRLVRARLRD